MGASFRSPWRSEFAEKPTLSLTRVCWNVTQSTTIHSIFFSGESKRPADFCPAGMRWSAREAAGTTSHELPQGRIEKGVAAECSDSVWRPGLYLSIAPSHLSLSGSRTETGGSGHHGD